MLLTSLRWKKNKERINLVHFRNVEEEYSSQNQMTTSHNTRKHFALSHAHFRTDGPKVTVLYIGQNLKSNTFRLGLKNIALSIGLDNGWEATVRQRGRGCYFQVLTRRFSLTYTRVTYHITWPGSDRFQNGRRLSVKKICRKFGFAQYIIYLSI